MRAGTLDVLVVDDEPALREVLSVRLQDWGFSVSTAADASEADAMLAKAHPDLVLTDVVLPGTSGIELLRRLKRHDPSLPVILMTAHANVDAAVEAMKVGATDFLTKPIDSANLRSLLDAVASERRQRAADEGLDSALAASSSPAGLIGASPAMRTLQRQLAQLAASDASGLLTGESGTGKEVAARTVHALSSRRDRPFIAVNAAAIPDGLVESEIFGHEQGAFTGASRSRAGCFEIADGGTLFLDEISEMPMSLQPKLLRVLEDGKTRRLGSSREVAFDVRVLAATNVRPADAVRDGRLREDLWYRLNVFELNLPPLRERGADIPLLVRHFIHVFNEKHDTTVQGVREPTLARLEGWHWPGNVRELRNVVERAVVIARQGWIEPAHLPPYVKEDLAAAAQPLAVPPNATLAEAERLVVLSTLERTGHNKAAAARHLGLDVKTIRNKLRGWGVEG
ncbi:MAG TPA: sigma-54 dependent transcriptional regulator [Gemmatimonadaceae bacterium]|nr:sigma-54 dependent transcriptional regulator [Gemmatimonadaceae bacterium]